MNKLIKLAEKFAIKYASSEYKCRAETIVDVEGFMEACQKAEVEISDVRIDPQFLEYKGKKVPIPDVEFTFKSNEELGTLKHIMNTVPDGHVMSESLNHSSHYTGERSYEGKLQLD